MGRAELARHVEAVVVDVRGDDLRHARVARRHDRCQPYRTNPDDEDRIAQLRTRLVEDGARASREAARQRTEQLERHVVGHLHHSIGGHDGVRGE